MGWVRGYRFYRSDEQREGPVFYFRYYDSSLIVLYVSVFLGVFWGGIRYTLHVFSVRGVIKYDEIIVKIIQLCFDKEFYLYPIRMRFL